MARRHFKNKLGVGVLFCVCLIGGAIPSFARPQLSSANNEVQSLRSEVDRLRTEIATLKKEAILARDALERQKLQSEINKLNVENTVLKKSTVGWGRLLPWLQAGLGTLVGGLLVLLAGHRLTQVQRKKLKQDLAFAKEDHELQTEKLAQELRTAKENHELQSRKLTEEIRISRSEHDFKLFEALGSHEPRIRLGAASELGQRVHELNERSSSSSISEQERNSCERERMTIVSVLIAVTKHENNEELQKHIADLIVEVLKAHTKTSAKEPNSPLAKFDFQAARLTNAWWKGVDARGSDFYKACLVRAGLANSQLSKAIFKNADLREATLREADAEEVNFEGADMSDIKAQRANLKHAVLKNANLKNANLSHANLEGADLREATVAGADFSGVQMRKAKLQGVDFRSANVKGIDFTEAETDANTKIN